MHIGGFPPHRMEQEGFIPRFGERGKLDPGTVWSEPAHDPIAAHMYEGVPDAHSAGDELLAPDFLRKLLRAGPNTPRGHQRLGLADDATASPIGQRDNALAAQAAKPGNPPLAPVFQAGLRQQFFQPPAGLLGNRALPLWQRFHFLPENHRIAQLIQRHIAQPLVVLRQDKRAAAGAQALAVAFQNRFAGLASSDGQVLLLRGNPRARRQAHQIIGVRHGVSFIEIVDAPDEPPLRIAPASEVFDVKVPDCQDGRSSSQLRADLLPELHPTIEGRAKEWKDSRGHLLMFEPEINRNERGARRHPLLVEPGGLADLHSCLRLSRMYSPLTESAQLKLFARPFGYRIHFGRAQSATGLSPPEECARHSLAISGCAERPAEIHTGLPAWRSAIYGPVRFYPALRAPRQAVEGICFST